MKYGICEYCSTRKAPLFIGPPETDQEIYVCQSCIKLLKNPITALPLIRGNLTMKLRGTIPEEVLNRMLQSFMEKISKFESDN